jgi:acetyl/propionyl-CoA carboxylase alpha subunit
VDSGVVEGDEVGVNYDPLLAKLTVQGETRDIAIERALNALRRYAILGTRTNIPFLIKLLELPALRAGAMHTGMIDEHLDELTADRDVPPEALAAAAWASAPSIRAGSHVARSATADPFTSLRRWGR